MCVIYVLHSTSLKFGETLDGDVIACFIYWSLGSLFNAVDSDVKDYLIEFSYIHELQKTWISLNTQFGPSVTPWLSSKFLKTDLYFVKLGRNWKFGWGMFYSASHIFWRLFHHQETLVFLEDSNLYPIA